MTGSFICRTKVVENQVVCVFDRINFARDIGTNCYKRAVLRQVGLPGL